MSEKEKDQSDRFRAIVTPPSSLLPPPSSLLLLPPPSSLLPPPSSLLTPHSSLLPRLYVLPSRPTCTGVSEAAATRRPSYLPLSSTPNRPTCSSWPATSAWTLPSMPAWTSSPACPAAKPWSRAITTSGFRKKTSAAIPCGCTAKTCRGDCEAHGFHYLDAGPLLLPEAGLGLVGSMNWYDYSWALTALRQNYPMEEGRLRSKRFTRGRHNDGNFVRWPRDDVSFTAEVVGTLERHLLLTLAEVGQALVVTHHPAFYGLNFPRSAPPSSLDGLLWDAFSGNQALERLLQTHAGRVPFVFSAHTHRARENTLGAIRGYNIGGDYHFKRLLCLTWPEGTVEAHTFGDAN